MLQSTSANAMLAPPATVASRCQAGLSAAMTAAIAASAAANGAESVATRARSVRAMRWTSTAAIPSARAEASAARNACVPRGIRPDSCVATMDTVPPKWMATRPWSRTAGRSARHCALPERRQIVTATGSAATSHSSARSYHADAACRVLVGLSVTFEFVPDARDC